MAKICIVIPAYNEEHAIADTIADYGAHFPDAVMVVVDNNSKDRTYEIVEEEFRGTRHLLLREGEQGKGRAVKKALSRIVADVFIMIDADHTYPATDARRLCDELIRERCDMVVGDRVSDGAYDKQNTRSFHGFGNRVLTQLISFLSNKRYRDVLSGMRIMSAPFVTLLDVQSHGFQLETELNVIAAYAKADVREIPIDYRARKEDSESKLDTFRDGARILMFAIINAITFYPFVIFGLAGALCLLISLIWGIFIISTFFKFGEVPYIATTVAAATFGMVGLQSLYSGLVLGIIGGDRRRSTIADFLQRKREWNAHLDRLEADG
ncbi:glycosyltransferase family 2 protein [Amorphus orientalis]|uniref:Glycosyltransferase involved in cell wall biosynthesis n=1 Tax=Amorphus orientalis TaxID=649198 RepID=A0AAE3VQ16_9HYPH|nr:glycosyltransferase family 2 protein [Amorphus orientalis]MDQ0316187.1 glycosyltransferase involved in cell wall biosynthesis [Amorphus orientalis]